MTTDGAAVAAAKVEAMDIDEKKDETSQPFEAPAEKVETGEPSNKEGEAEDAATKNESVAAAVAANEAAAAGAEGEASASAPASDDSGSDLFEDGDGDDEEDKATPPSDPTELILQAMEQKEEGNNAFKSGDLTTAVRSYRKGTTLLKPLNKNNTGDEQVKSLLLTLQTNLSMVCFKQDKPKMSRDVASSALEVDSCNVKALYRRAAAHRKLGDAESARADLREALKHDPNNREVRRELAAIKKEIEQSKIKEKERLQKAFASKAGSSFLYDDKEEEERKKAEAKKAKKQAEAEALKKRKAEWENDCVKRMANDEPAISFEDWEKERKKKEDEDEKARKKARKEEEERKRAERKAAREAAKDNTGTAEPESDDDDELTEKEMQMMRGYKKTKDGRTTSYFTRELKDEEKAMLAQQVGPKRIDAASGGSGGGSNAAVPPSSLATATSPTASAPTPTPTPTPVASSGTAAASAWNQAGTWEEKDTTEWCTSCLKRHLTSASSAVASSEYTATVTEVKDLTGDASVVLTRGKKRYLFDYHLSLQFDVTHAGSADADEIDEDEVVATGTLKLPDISSTMTTEDLEIEPSSGWKKRPEETHSDGVVECRTVLMSDIREKVGRFVAEFNSQF